MPAAAVERRSGVLRRFKLLPSAGEAAAISIVARWKRASGGGSPFQFSVLGWFMVRAETYLSMAVRRWKEVL